MITLNLRPALESMQKSLCTGCVYSHIVRGYRSGEELIVCGYAFPPREILFPVRECTDFRAKRDELTKACTINAWTFHSDQ